ncbi:MAG: hypothetical protein NTZ95_01520, partial [Candidatus Omnitrophica bacterium]|nr:hypothetical protein [Candidatus Omnitrophota bacterium]
CVVLRSQSLVPYFSEYTRVYLVEHYSKHSLKEANPYKKDGFILWIGRFEHISYVIEFLRGNKLPLPIRFLSNMRTNRKSYDLGFNLLRQMGLKKEIKKYDIEEWDTEKQEQLMREAKAALDITGTTFKEIHKPSAKVQQFILSGIPVATNAGCNSYNYLKSKEFNICTPYETKRWLSEIYWEETVRFADKLKDVCSLQQVVDNYKEIISEQIVSR